MKEEEEEEKSTNYETPHYAIFYNLILFPPIRFKLSLEYHALKQENAGILP
jgi:hypothetical protein